MKSLLTSLLGATLLLGGSLFVTAVRAQNQNRPAQQASRTRRVRVADNHPKIREAIAALEAARAELEQSSGDFGGHKTDAIEAVNNALKRLRLALQFEKY